MQFFSFYKTLVDKEVVVELKNGMRIKGVLHAVDQYLNFKLEKIQVLDPEQYPHMNSLEDCFIRGSVVRYVHLNPADVDTDLLQDATRRSMRRVQ